MGLVRFEVPFFLAFLCAVREPKFAELTFFLPSLLFDMMDGQFSSTLSHLIVFILIKRLKFIMDFSRLPGSLVLGCLMAALDRVFYGLLLGFQIQNGEGIIFKAILDPAYGLTVLCLPVGFMWMRPRE